MHGSIRSVELIDRSSGNDGEIGTEKTIGINRSKLGQMDRGAGRCKCGQIEAALDSNISAASW